VSDQELRQLLNRAAAALERPADLDPQDAKALIEELTQVASQAKEVSTVVIDLTCGEFHAAYAKESLNVIVIRHDHDDIAAADDNTLPTAMDGDHVYVVSHSSRIAPNVVGHYLTETAKVPNAAALG